MEPEDAPVHGPHGDQLGYAGLVAVGEGVGVRWAKPWGQKVPPALPQLPSRVLGVGPPCSALGWEGTKSPV